MPSPLGTGRASTRAGSSRSSTTPTAAVLSPGPATGHGDALQDLERARDKEQQEQPRTRQEEHHQQQQQQQQQQDHRQHSNYGHHGARAGYFPAQVRRLPFDMSTYAHFMLTHTKHQMDAVPDAEPPPAHLSIAGLPRDLGARPHTGRQEPQDYRERRPNSSRTSTADAANGASSR